MYICTAIKPAVADILFISESKGTMIRIFELFLLELACYNLQTGIDGVCFRHELFRLLLLALTAV